MQNLDALRKYPLYACPEAREAGNGERGELTIPYEFFVQKGI